MKTNSPIEKYRREHDRMSLEEFGALFDPPVNKSTVMRWERYGVPLDRARAVEERTGIPRNLLRPDVFGQYSEAAE